MNYIGILLIIFHLAEFSYCQNNNCLQVESVKNSRNARIVGGINAKENEIPFIVSLTRRGGHLCGATIINENWLLTAAHCICNGLNRFLKPTHLKGIVGLYRFSDYRKGNDDQEESNSPYEVHLKSIITYPNYDCNRKENDIALLQLSEPIIFTSNVHPVCIPVRDVTNTSSRYQQDNKATVFGWGWTNENPEKGMRADTLQKAEVKVWKNEKCEKSYRERGNENTIKNTQICAGYEEGGIDACWADSGGPLISEGNILIGIVSTGVGCARPGLPGIYTRVSKYTEWIKTVIAN